MNLAPGKYKVSYLINDDVKEREISVKENQIFKFTEKEFKGKI